MAAVSLFDFKNKKNPEPMELYYKTKKIFLNVKKKEKMMGFHLGSHFQLLLNPPKFQRTCPLEAFSVGMYQFNYDFAF